MSETTKWLMQAAEEIRKEGHAGWGNTCEQAAERMAELEQHLTELESVYPALAAERDQFKRDKERLEQQLAERVKAEQAVLAAYPKEGYYTRGTDINIAIDKLAALVEGVSDEQ